jgi:hypothetical protein
LILEGVTVDWLLLGKHLDVQGSGFRVQGSGFTVMAGVRVGIGF